jgi:hypothetical protein
MDTHRKSPVKGLGRHPLRLLAALAVLLLGIVGSAAIMGQPPSSTGDAAAQQLPDADRIAHAAPLPQQHVAPPAKPVKLAAANEPDSNWCSNCGNIESVRMVTDQDEGDMKASQTCEIRVRLDDGSLRTFHQGGEPSWRNGERVRVVSGKLRRA